MASICTASTSQLGCPGHRSLTAIIDNQSITVDLDEPEAQKPLTLDDRKKLLVFLSRVKRQQGVPLAQFLNRVLLGDEATNVKQYPFFGPGAAVTKTNIGTAYTNVLPGANGERVLVDFTGCVDFRFILSVNLVGTGAFGARVIRDSDSTVLIENAALGAAGERELDSGWLELPGWAVGQGEVLLRLQAKSVTASDDPVFRRGLVLVR